MWYLQLMLITIQYKWPNIVVSHRTPADLVGRIFGYARPLIKSQFNRLQGTKHYKYDKLYVNQHILYKWFMCKPFRHSNKTQIAILKINHVFFFNLCTINSGFLGTNLIIIIWYSKTISFNGITEQSNYWNVTRHVAKQYNWD